MLFRAMRCPTATTEAIETTANAPIASPDATLIRRIQAVVTRVRTTDTIEVRSTHQAHDPRNTPIVIRAAPAVSPPVTPSPANSAPNDRIVIGLVNVRPRIERYAPASPPRRGGAVAGSWGSERAVVQASQSRNAPPRRPSSGRASTRTCVMAPRPERGDRAVGAIGGRHAEPGRESHHPALGQGPADDERG